MWYGQAYLDPSFLELNDTRLINSDRVNHNQ